MKIQIGQLHSSVAHHLSIEKQYQSQLVTPSNEVEAIVGMMFKSTSRFDLSLSLDEVCRWHHALFPQGVSGMYDMNVVALPDDTNDPMQVVSGTNGKAKGHFEAPQVDRLADELERFFQ